MKKVFFKLLPFLYGWGIVILDYKSKGYALAHIPDAYSQIFPYGGIAVFEDLFQGIDFSLNLVKNTGAAWGLFDQFPNALAIVRIAIVVYLVKKFVFGRSGIFRRLCFASISAGALGNLIDHFRYGFVVDMFHFTFWGYQFPVFNIADAFICLGAFGLIFSKHRKHT